ncbi:MAG: hypothetical protein GWP17_02300 [Aquificales bacterium]|nr:hypothetical protein [Aquificales bacterium]
MMMGKTAVMAHFGDVSRLRVQYRLCFADLPLYSFLPSRWLLVNSPLA